MDFDEDKRSCRRKLERHNKRRRRKPDSKCMLEKEIDDQLDLSADGSGGGELREGSDNHIFFNFVRKIYFFYCSLFSYLRACLDDGSHGFRKHRN